MNARIASCVIAVLLAAACRSGLMEPEPEPTANCNPAAHSQDPVTGTTIFVGVTCDDEEARER